MILPSLPAVITLRCMVQFIGRETKYRYGVGSWGCCGGGGMPTHRVPSDRGALFFLPSGTLSAFATIYREEGILGFFA